MTTENLPVESDEDVTLMIAEMRTEA